MLLFLHLTVGETIGGTINTDGGNHIPIAQSHLRRGCCVACSVYVVLISLGRITALLKSTGIV